MRRLSTALILAVASGTLVAACGAPTAAEGESRPTGSTSATAGSGTVADPRAGVGARKVGDVLLGNLLVKSMRAAMAEARTGTYSEVEGDRTEKGTFVFRADGGVDEDIDTGDGVRVRLVDKDIYVSGGQRQRTTWVKVDPNTTDPYLQGFLGWGKHQAVAQRPLMYLMGFEVKVTAVSGDSTTYEFTYDPSVWATPEPSASSTSGPPPKFVYVVDREGRPVTVTRTGELSSTVTYGDWGADLKVVPPPTDQTGPA